MKTMLLAFFVLFCLDCVGAQELPVSPVEGQKDEAQSLVQLDVTLNKRSYVVGEPIVVSARLANRGAEPLSGYWLSLPNSFQIRVRDARNWEVQMHSSSPEGRITFGISKIVPGVAATTDVDIVVGDVLESSELAPRAKLSAGTYTLYASQSVFVGDRYGIPAKALATFEVREPTATEKRALEMFKVRVLPADAYAEILKRSDLKPELRQLVVKQWNEVVTTYERLYQLYPETPYAPYTLYYTGRIREKQERWSEAIACYERLLREHPEFAQKADVLFYLSSTYERAGQKEKALSVLENLKKLAPNHLVAPTVHYFCNPSRIEALEQLLNAK